MLHLCRKTSPSWADKMEEVTRPFQVANKEQAYEAFCSVLVKQNKLFTGEHSLDREQKASIDAQFNQFKIESWKLREQGASVLDCAKKYYCMCHTWLITATKEWGLDGYNLYLEGLWVSHQLLEYLNYDGARRLQYLIDHPREGIDSYSFFRETQKAALPQTTEADEDCISNDISDELKARYWELYNPQDPAAIMEEASLGENLSFGEGFLAIEKYDSEYIKCVLKEKVKLLAKRDKGLITHDEETDLAFLENILQDAMGLRKDGLGYAPKRKRFFKKPENNRAYACIKISINRMINVFPEGSPEKEMILRNFSFANGKFCWGTPHDQNRPA